MVYTYDVLIIGGGPAGMAAAERAAELGAKTAVVERSALGGTCLNSGCVPTRVLAKTARLYREVRTAFDYGIVVQEPAVDWKKTVTRVRDTVQRVLEAKQYDAMMERLGIDLFSGQAMFTGDHTVDVDGQELSARSIILCVGGAARRLPVAGAELSVLPDEVLALTELPGRLAIIGGGHTGAQLTTIFNALGSEVLLLDVAQRLLLTEDDDVAAFVGQSFVSKGIRVETGIEGIAGISRTADGGSLSISWTRNGEASTADVDAVIMAAGWPANIPGLGLETAGVETQRSFIPVDDYLRTNVPHIFVAGDANGTSMLVQAAVFEGETAASNAVLGANRTTPHHLLPEGGFTDPDYAGVGLTEKQARKRDSGCRSVTVPYAAVERPIIDDRETGFLKLVTDRHGELILGAHAVGENAVEVVQAVASAMAAGTDLATLARVKFAYPTYSAILAARPGRLHGSSCHRQSKALYCNLTVALWMEWCNYMVAVHHRKETGIMTTTTNQPSVIDAGELTVRRTISIAAPIEKVWAAITEPGHIAKWFGQSAVLDDVAVGASGVFSFEGHGDVPVRIEELDAPRMVAYRWSNEVSAAGVPAHLDPGHSTVFRFTLEPLDGGTQLTVVESGFETHANPSSAMEDHRGGWDAELDELVAYLEGGS